MGFLMAATDEARDRLMVVAIDTLPPANTSTHLPSAHDVRLAVRVVDALFTDENFNNIIRVLGGKVAGLDQRMRPQYGSSVLFKQGGDLYE